MRPAVYRGAIKNQQLNQRDIDGKSHQPESDRKCGYLVPVDAMSNSNSNSNANSNSNSNPRDSVDNSSNASRSPSPYGDPILLQYDAMGAQTHDRGYGQNLNLHQQSMFDRLDLNAPNGASRFLRPSTPALVYIVTSHFTSQMTSDGVRLSESDIVGFQILAVFARLEDANAYAEQEFEEIDAGVRRRRRGRPRGRGAAVEEGEGVDTETSVDEDGSMSWLIEGVGRIEVGQWVVQ